MNLPSPDEQLDLHGPRAQLPFEQIPPQSRAGVKSSHESLDKGFVPLVSNGVITSGGPPDAGSSKSGGSGNRDEADTQVSTASPLSTLVPSSTPHHHSDPARPSSAAMASSALTEKHPQAKNNPNTSTSNMADRPQRPLHVQQSSSYGVHDEDMIPPPAKPSRFQNFAAVFRRFLGFVGPGYIVSVGYMDPGNWATDLAGGSSFGYMLLFVILLSNMMAIVLQGLAVKLGVVSGLDLAQACRKFTPKYVNWILYVLAELAIIACDLAEVIGSAIALNLLFKIPLAWGVVITAVDVLIILLAFRDDQSVKSRRLFEALVILLVTAVGICFTAEIIISQPVAKDVFRGFLPSSEILTNSEALYLAIGIIGATVMPHNLYLHSSIVKLRATTELNKLASSQASMSSSCDLMNSDERQAMLESDKGAVSVKHSTIRTTLKYTFVDSTVALTFALYVNSAILIVSAATFKYKFPDANNEGLADFFDAFRLLSEYLGKAAGYIFAVALLMAGQSSTLTATLAGQIIMEGFLGTSYLKPWVRRLLTRSLAIIPALAIVLIKGQNGLSELLLASQVALSVQLPFAVIPLVIFTSMGRCMTIPVQDNDDKPGETTKGGHVRYEEELKKQQATDDAAVPAIAPASPSQTDEEATTPVAVADSSKLLLHNFANPWWLVGISGLISIILLSLNFYLLLQTLRGE
ncbi:hypothetical protein BG006_002019 [Podila minutissima]|uniref:Natural resistance-associated macrophage protein n=1 Tax=Podila minutissima TaxID=64525 RepID=A0A9P5SPI4_9FUNG|nr:hypothetical protein BG006_002019 [Podila minutissima]